MSERASWRSLPPVEENVEAPARLSQTLLSHASLCPRAAYLYLKYGGGVGSQYLLRGTAVHAVAERIMLELIRSGEKSLHATGMVVAADGEIVAEDVKAKEEVASLSKAIADEVIRDLTPGLSPLEADAVRNMAYHLALGMDVDPEHVVGIERKFVLKLESGWLVSGKIDLAALPEDRKAQVDDYKTSFHVPTESEFAESFQTRLYAIMLVFGNPVDKVIGPGGEIVEELGPNIGEFIAEVRAREIYPRYLQKDGTLKTRETTFSRKELADARADIERIALTVEHGLNTGDWPAIPGDAQCGRCPARGECPLPAAARESFVALGLDEGGKATALRDGVLATLETREDAAAALEQADVLARQAKALKEAAKELAKQQEWRAIPMGADEVYEFVVSSGQALKKKGQSSDWEGLKEAIHAALEDGAGFDLLDWLKPTTTTNFKKRRLAKGESVITNEEEQHGRDGAGSGGGERFGDDAPW
jgi:hypothetical protein